MVLCLGPSLIITDSFISNGPVFVMIIFFLSYFIHTKVIMVLASHFECQVVIKTMDLSEAHWQIINIKALSGELEGA